MTRRRREWLAIAAVAIICQLSCGSGESGGGSPTGTKNPGVAPTITPGLTAAAPGTTIAFAAKDPAGGAVPVTWRVNGIAGGTPQLGLISAAGVYTAPSVIPAGDSVVVGAVVTADPTLGSASTVLFIPDLSTKDYYVPMPRVIDATHPQPTRFLLVPPAAATSVSFVPLAGASVPLTPIGNGVLSFVLDAASALAGYQSATLHNLIGRLDYRDAAGGSVKLTSLSVNVRESSMPDVAITALAADAQRSPYILNLRVDAATINATTAIVSRALQLLGGDQFDVVDVVASVTSNNNRNYVGLRNDIRGIGQSTFDNSASAGGRGRLRGFISFPIDGLFDGADQGFMHETGHSWINYATDPVLAPGVPHWPPSTMAHGTMGFSIGGTGGEGGQFPWTLTPVGNGNVRVNLTTQSDRFTPLDLYVMGLLPPDSVPPMYVLPPTVTSASIVDGATLPATTYTIDNYVASQGTRVPASSAAPRAFAAAVVVLTFGRLMTASEMAFFDAASARAETKVSLRSSVGFVIEDASGFFLATGGRATMKTRLP